MLTSKACNEKRLLLGFTQKEVAEAAGLERVTVWKFETGRIVSPFSIRKIAVALEKLEQSQRV